MVKNYTFFYHNGERIGDTDESDSKCEYYENEIGKDDFEEKYMKSFQIFILILIYKT